MPTYFNENRNQVQDLIETFESRVVTWEGISMFNVFQVLDAFRDFLMLNEWIPRSLIRNCECT
jgi:hypothetical protein